MLRSKSGIYDDDLKEESNAWVTQFEDVNLVVQTIGKNDIGKPETLPQFEVTNNGYNVSFGSTKWQDKDSERRKNNAPGKILYPGITLLLLIS